MWYKMPTGPEAERVAATAELQRRLAAMRCVTTLLAREDRGATAQELLLVMTQQIEVAEDVVERWRQANARERG